MRLALVLLYASTAVGALVPAVASWRRRAVTPVAGPLTLILIGVSAWATAQTLAVALADLAWQTAFSYAIFPGVAAVVAGFYWQSRIYAGYRARPSRRTVLLLAVEPVLVSVVAATNDWHRLFFTSVEPGRAGTLVLQPGPLYWVHTTYSYLLMAAGLLLVVRAMLRAVAGQRRALGAFLLGGSAPTVANVITVFAGGLESLELDLTSVAFLVTAAVWWWAERDGTNSRPVPVAYPQVLAALGDAVVVVDPHGTVIEVNPAAERLLGRSMTGRAWRDVAGIDLAGGRHSTMAGADGTTLDIRVVEMRAPGDGQRAGWVVVARDVTELERLRAELTEQAARDHLTGLYNRRHLTAVLNTAVAAGGELSVVMLDVDHFKSVNDRFGHAVGDRLLIALAAEITAAAGPGATVARYGGEEFVLVVPGVSGPAAIAGAERLRLRCAGLTLDTDQGSLYPTISAGVAWLTPATAADDLLRAADQALYAAKAAGRNRVVSADEVTLAG